MKLFKSLFITALITASFSSFAEVAVIVSASNGNGQIDKSTIAKIFLGKTKNFPDGSQAIPVDQNEGSPARNSFNSSILGKSASQLKSYWSRLIFTGKGTPPKQSGTDNEIRALVAANPNLIGYVDASSIDPSVKVVFSF